MQREVKAMSCNKYIVLFSLETMGETGSQLGSDGTDIATITWQVLDVARNQVQPVQRKFIKPRMPVAGSKPLLCGIQASDFSGAEDLPSVLAQFQPVVDKLESFSFVVNGPLPLRQCLHPEASRNKITLPDYFYTYVDLKKEVSKSVPSVPLSSSLQDIANILGLSTVPLGDPLCGKEEVEAMCAITQKLLSQGHVFSLAETIDKSCDFHTALSITSVPNKNIVRLRGLPFQASFEDVAGFMAGLNIVPGGIVFGISAVGRRTGEAIVVLQDEEHAQLALRRHHHYLNQRYIEVYEASAEDLVQFAGSLGVGKESGTQNSSGVCVLRLQGLPYRATQQEIVQFFSDVVAVRGEEAGVFIVRYPDGKASGDAFVLFSEDEVEIAMSKNKKPLGHRYVDIFKSTSKELESVLYKSATEEQLAHFAGILGISVAKADHHGTLRGVEKNCVKLRGLPWSTTSEQVVEFFGPELQNEIVSQGVHMVQNCQNRPTGDCYVQLKTVEAAKEASETLHKQHMGTRYIEVFQCTGDEVAHALMHVGAGAGRGGGAFRGRRRRDEGDSGRGGGGNTVKARGLPYSTTVEEIAEFFAGYNVSEKEVEIVYDNYERSTGVAFISFSTPSIAQQAIREKNGQNIGRRYVELSLS